MNFLEGIIYKNKVSKETFWAIVSKVISILSGLFILIFIPKTAGIETYGNFSLILAYVSILGVFFGTPIHIAVKKEMTEGKFNNLSRNYFLEGIKLKLILSFLATMILFIFLSFVDMQILKDNFVLFIILILFMNLWGSVVTGFESVHRLAYESFIYLLEYSTKIILILYFYFFSKLTLGNLLISFISGYGIAFLVGLTIFVVKFDRFNVYKLVKIDTNIFKKILYRSFFLSLTGISFIILSKIDVIMISFLLTIKDVGYYSIASDIAKATTIISIPFILGVIPLFANEKTLKKLFSINLKKLFLINILIFLFFLISSNYIIDIIYGKGYEPVANVLKILALFPLLATLQNFTQDILILKDAIKKIFVFGLIAMLLNIFLNYFGILLFGIIGAALSTLVSYSVWFGLNYIYLKKNYLV